MFFYGRDKYWIFKLDDVKRNFIIDLILAESSEIEVKYEVKSIQKKEFYGQVVLLYFDNNKKDYVFEYEATIKSHAFITEKNGAIFVKIVFDNIKSIKTKISLDEIKYSIKSFKNLISPNRNFNSNLIPISKIEFEAIKFGDIFYSRTIFLKLYEVLPYEHKFAFYKIIFDLSPDNLKLTNDHALLLSELMIYIENNILKPASIFVQSYEILKKNVPEIDLKDIGFSNNEKQVDYLLPQVEFSKSFISIYEKMPFSEMLESYDDFKQTELEFKKVFKNIPSPIRFI